MADKGFDIKVLVPTNDGINICVDCLERALYFLTYNVSNRSYQFGRKLKVSDIFTGENFAEFVNKIIIDNNIDFIIHKRFNGLNNKFLGTKTIEINEFLNKLIDNIDQGNELPDNFQE